jgi:DNA-binding transcriptional MocR family regulator
MSLATQPLRHHRAQDEVCETIRNRIESGIYHAGDKISSVRELSRQLGLSISTVLEAYRRLETEGVIAAQPQSGFYVQLAATRRLVRSAYTHPSRQPMDVSSESLVKNVLQDARNPAVLQLAKATPETSLLPVASLQRVLVGAMRENGDEVVGTTMTGGYRPLREQIARRMLAAGCAVAPDEVLVTSGCTEALNLALRAVCKPGDIVAVESPTFYGMLLACEALGIRVLEVSTSTRDGMCLDSLKELLDEHPVRAVVLTPSFGNPLGGLMSDEDKAALVRMVSERDVYLIEDDVYGDLGFAEGRPIAAKAYDRTGHVLYCSSFSKTLAPGYRVGWVVGGPLTEKLEALKFSSSLATAGLQQMAIANFLAFQRYTHYIRRAARTYQQNTNRMVSTVLKTFPTGTQCQKPKGGFVVWVQMPDGCDAIRLYQTAIAKHLNFMPGPAFSPSGLYRNCLRINAARWDPNIEAAIATLGELAKACVV